MASSEPVSGPMSHAGAARCSGGDAHVNNRSRVLEAAAARRPARTPHTGASLSNLAPPRSKA